MTSPTLISTYEDGSVHRCPLSTWVYDNAHDPEALALLGRLQDGQTVHLGGGAQPLCSMHLEAGQGIQGTIQHDGTVTLTWNHQATRLMSPDSTQQCLPCKRCGEPQWASPNAVAILCDRCAQCLSEDLGDLGPAVASGEISEADAIMDVARREYPRPW